MSMNAISGANAPSGLTLELNDEFTLDNTGFCLLALDGGGVRGLSTLYILQSVMYRLNLLRQEAGLQPKKPCELFDLIGGTSTGGLIAIMLGRLEMTVDECIKSYIQLMSQVFEKKENISFMGILGGVKPRFSSAALKNAISQVLLSRNIALDEKFDDGTKPRCKVLVCTNLQATNTVTRLRSYKTPSSGHAFTPTILEAALATSAAPTYFSDVDIKGSKFVDGAIGANNPTAVIEEEAQDLWCEDSGNLQPLVKCFISIGTGHLGLRSVSDKSLAHLVKTLEKEALQTERTNQQFLARWRDHVDKGRCYRFNVGHGLEKVGIAEHKQQDLIQAATSSYLQERVTMRSVRSCVQNLRLKQHQPTIAFANRLVEEGHGEKQGRPATNQATSSEILELISLGSAELKTPAARMTKQNFIQARHCFSKALHYLQKDPSTTPKQVARVCQKLSEATLGLSQIARAPEERKEHADQAQRYGDFALENVIKSGDQCMIAQMEFMLAVVTAWKVYLQLRTSGEEVHNSAERKQVETLLHGRVDKLRQFPNLDIARYETQANTYIGYLMGL